MPALPREVAPPTLQELRKWVRWFSLISSLSSKKTSKKFFIASPAIIEIP